MVKDVKDLHVDRRRILLNTPHIKEASGAIANFKTDVPANLKKCVVDIDPVQDLHGYEYPWPPGGGKNKTDYSTPFVGTVGEQKNYALFTMVLPAGEYTYSCKQSVTIPSNTRNTLNVKVGENNIVYEYATGVNYNPPDLRHKMTFTVSEESTCVFSYWSHTPSVSATLTEWQVEVGSFFTGYAPYSNICPISGRTEMEVWKSGDESYFATYIPITFPTEAGTVYGGTLDLLSGELVVDRAIVDLGTLDWTITKPQSGNTYLTCKNNVGAKIPLDANKVTRSICERYKYTKQTNWPLNMPCILIDRSGRFVIGDKSFSDLATFETEISGTHFCYELAEPTTYQLTAQTLKSLRGVNNIWSDAGDTTVKYWGH